MAGGASAVNSSREKTSKAGRSNATEPNDAKNWQNLALLAINSAGHVPIELFTSQFAAIKE
jgi:hypothetical protein